MIDDERVVRTTDYTYFHDSVMVVNEPPNPLVPGLYDFRIEMVVIGSMTPVEDDLKSTAGFVRVLEAPAVPGFGNIMM